MHIYTNIHNNRHTTHPSCLPGGGELVGAGSLTVQPLCRARARFTPRLSPDSCMLQQEKGARAEAPQEGWLESTARGEERSRWLASCARPWESGATGTEALRRELAVATSPARRARNPVLLAWPCPLPPHHWEARPTGDPWGCSSAETPTRAAGCGPTPQHEN